MSVAVVSDLHLGTRTRVDLLRLEAVRDRLAEFLEGVDELVLLGDALELRDRTAGAAVAAAAPVLAAMGRAVRGRVVLVPGNHDHRLALEAGPGATRPGGQAVDPRTPGLLGGVRRALGAELVVAYPGWSVAPGVWATHGHYLDAHSAAPTLETVLAAALGRLRGVDHGPASSADYELLLAPAYELYYWLAQRPRAHRAADVAKHAVRRVETALGTRGPAGAGDRDRVAAALRRTPWAARCGTVDGELRRPGVLPLRRVLERLDVEARHVLFGHTHRTGPVDGDPLPTWRGPGGCQLWNTGSWVFEPAYHGSLGAASPYWPGTVVTVEVGRPRLHRLLDTWIPPAAAVRFMTRV